MLPLVLLGVIAYFFYNKYEHALAVSPNAAGVVTNMHTGLSYAFQVLSPLDSATLIAELSAVGANVIGMPVMTGANVWSGVFTWNGADMEPTEHLNNITWILLSPTAIQTSPTTIVSGMAPGNYPLWPAMGSDQQINDRSDQLMMYLGGPSTNGTSCK